jgi:hypothetical protein
MTKRHNLWISAASLLAVSAIADAQERPAPVTPDSPISASKSTTPPGAEYLSSRYGISMEEAAMRINLQAEIAALVQQVQADSSADIAGIWVQHTPVFKIVIGFTDPDDKKLVRYQISPKIRRYVSLKQMPRGRKAVLAEQDLINSSIGEAGVKDFTSEIEEETGKIIVRVESDGDRQRLAPILAKISPEATIEVKPIPKEAAAPVGVQVGDYLYGGFYYYFDQTTQACSFAFPAKLGSTQGILTAGHCNPGTDGKYWYAIKGHWVQLPAPTIARWKYGTKYDYQFHETTGLTTGAWVYYENRATEPAYPASGYFQVSGTLGYYGQTKGMTICKAGWRTGLVCGTIDNGAYTYNGVKGWIHVARASGTALALPGDSGSGVFSPADSSGRITAYGITTAGQQFSDGSSEMVYGPIDYVDDEAAITLITAP